MIRSISAGPLPQLAPITRTPRPAIAASAFTGETPIIVWKCVSKLIVTTAGKPASRAPSTAACTSSSALMVSISAKSTPPALSDLRLLGERRARAVRRQEAERLHQLAGRAHGTGHQAVAGRFAREPRAGLVELGEAVLEPVERQAVARAAERVGRDEVAAGIDIRAVNREDDVGPLCVPALRRAVREAGLVQHRAHGTVAEHEAAALDQLK